MPLPFSITEVFRESEFLTSRSGGPGGQNVNKVSSRVTLRWNVGKSLILDDDQKARIVVRLNNRLTNDGDLIVVSQSSRSQHTNREEVKLRLEKLLLEAFKEKRIRRKTRPTSSAVGRRWDEKKKHSVKKRLRRQKE